MTTPLYIIGNGFDLHHGIPSRYKDFGEFVRRSDHELFDEVEKYLGSDDEFWSDFEARLANFDVDALIANAEDFLIPYGAEGWKDSSHHDYQFEIQRVVVALSRGLTDQFGVWIRQLEMPERAAIIAKPLPLNSAATFLNFNYTPSITKLYGIPRSQILHVHGSAANVDDNLILGHGWSPKDRGSSNDGLDLEEADTREIEGNRLVDKYFQDTFKPTASIIAGLKSFFEGLGGTPVVFVMGHSLADVDLPYFKEVVKHIGEGAVRWKISYHSDNDLPRLTQQVKKLAVPSRHLVEFARLSEF